MLLKNRIAIVTGGAKGIGKGVVEKFADEGCSVAIADISDAEGKQVADEVTKSGGNCIFIHCDLTNSSQVKDMVNQTLGRFKKIDILVNVAGGVKAAHREENGITAISDEEWEWVINLNLKSTFFCCREVVPHMQKNRYGKIINFSSIGAIAPCGSVIAYHAAKGGVLGITTNLAYDLAPYNICVNAILPGPVRTPFYDALTRGFSEEDKDALFKGMVDRTVPLRRIGTPEDMAGAALFLASELSAFITGEHINVAGGIPLIVNRTTSQ